MDKNSAFVSPKPVRPTSKRSIIAQVASTSRKKPPVPTGTQISSRKSIAPTSSKLMNSTAIGDEIMGKCEASTPELDKAHAEIAYGKFVRTLLEECLVEEKIEREETRMDIQMALLSDRFQKTMDQLDKTNKRLKDISFVVEQKRLLDLKSQDCSDFCDITENSGIEEKINNLTAREEACLDKLETKNVDFGYDKDTGHQKLLDAVNDAIEGLECIKKKSNLDMDKFNEYEKTQINLEEFKKDKSDLNNVMTEFEIKFPKFSEKLLKEISEKVSMIMDNDDN